jgi:hypothetical protein
MKLKPLEQWICDACGNVIENPNDGWLEWLEDENHKAYGFRIVHHLSASPLKGSKSDGCYAYGREPGRSDNHLGHFLGVDGLAALLLFLDVGQMDPNDTGPHVRSAGELAELFRRLMMAHYEEARQYWESAVGDGQFDSGNELSPYTQLTLRSIVRDHGGKTHVHG